MPSIAQIPMSSSITSSSPGGKKRKREQLPYGDGEDYAKLNSIQYTSPLALSRPLSTTPPTDNIATTHSSPASRLLLKPRLLKPLRPHDAKRQRILVPEREKQDLEHEIYHAAPANVQSHHNPTNTRNEGVGEAYTRTDLSPCHICHQKPKVRTDLDSYGDCEGCGKRTCYICMRECLGPSSPSQLPSETGWGRGELGCEGVRDRMSFVGSDEWPRVDDLDCDTGAGHERDGDGGRVAWPGAGRGEWGHRGMVCSQCCVERGVDGEVWCLGCLRAEEVDDTPYSTELF